MARSDNTGIVPRALEAAGAETAARPDAVSEGKLPHRKPIVGDAVHFYDESRAGAYARMGIGPYAADVTCIDGGVALFVKGPQGGRFDVDRVAHKSELPDGPGKKRWWEWPVR